MKPAFDILLVIFVTLNYFAWKQSVAYEVNTSFKSVIYIALFWIIARIFFRIRKGNWQ